VDETARVIAGRYVIRAAIGQGGMGRVWRAHDRTLDREVALKEVLLPLGMAALAKSQLAERMLREARLGARLRHPAIVRVHDVLTADEHPWIVMELVEGRSLEDLIEAEGPLAPARVAAFGLSLLGALRAAHRSGVIHRDVKPANVIVEDDDAVVLTDFGIAYEMDQVSLTATGIMIGSPQFMAPERVRGESPGPASDLFSLGATLYAAVEGRAPFVRTGQLPTLAAVLSDPPDAFVHAGSLQPVLAGLLEKDPERRPTPEEAEEALRTVVALVDAPTTGDLSELRAGLVSAGDAQSPEPDTVIQHDSKPAVTTPGPAERYVPALESNQPPSPLLRRPWRIAAYIASAGAVALVVAIALIINFAPSKSDAPSSKSSAPSVDVAVLAGQAGSVGGMAFSPDGKTLATVNNSEFSVRLWDVATRKVTKTIKSGGQGLYAVAFSPDGRTIATGGHGDNTARLWDVATGKNTRILSGGKADGDYIYSMAFSPDGKTLATGNTNKVARLWDVTTGKNSATLLGHTGSWPSIIYAVAFSPDGKTLATGCADKTIRLWDVATHKTTTILTGHEWGVQSVAFSPDGRILATGSADKTVRLWDVATRKTSMTLTVHTGTVNHVAFNPTNGNMLATSGTNGDNTVRLWNLTTGTTSKTLTPGARGITSIAFSPDGSTIASAVEQDPNVRLWNVASTPAPGR
jgi:WD40 repeat protein